MKAKLRQAAIWFTLAILTGLAMVLAALSLSSGA
jgi:hypothetical protein